MTRYEVDGEQNRESFRRKPISSIEALIENRRVQKTDWIGVQPVELLQSSPRRYRHRRTGLRHLGILYHTIDFNGSSLGRGLHHRFIELLPIEPTENSFKRNPVRTLEGVETILSAQARVELLRGELPGREVQLSGGISLFGVDIARLPIPDAPFIKGVGGPIISGEAPLPARHLALAQYVAGQEGIEPTPIQVAA